jgi:hypothetical protein
VGSEVQVGRGVREGRGVRVGGPTGRVSSRGLPSLYA